MFLLGSSVALQWARMAARRRAVPAMQWGVALAALLAGAFLLGQLAVWNQLGERGYLVASNPSNSFFYLITSLHGAHLLRRAGRARLGRAGRVARDRPGTGALEAGVVQHLLALPVRRLAGDVRAAHQPAGDARRARRDLRHRTEVIAWPP